MWQRSTDYDTARATLALFFSKAHAVFHVNDTRAPTKASVLRPAQSSLRRLHRRRRCCCRRQAIAPRSRAHRRRSIVCVVSVVRSLFDVVIVSVVSFEEDRRASKFVHGYYQGEEKETRQRRSRQPEMSDHGCIHLNNFKAAKGIQPYKVIHSYFVTSTSTEARIRKVWLSFSYVIRGQGSVFVSLFLSFSLLLSISYYYIYFSFSII